MYYDFSVENPMIAQADRDNSINHGYDYYRVSFTNASGVETYDTRDTREQAESYAHKLARAYPDTEITVEQIDCDSFERETSCETVSIWTCEDGELMGG